MSGLRSRWIAVLSVLVLFLPCGDWRTARAATETGSERAFDFGLIGDFPYFAHDHVGMPNLVQDIREAEALRFVVHLGDLHNNDYTDCSEAFFRERLEMLEGIGHPLVFTPGDNDWADCRDVPLDHLTSLRRVFFPDPQRSLGPGGFAVRNQSEDGDYPEIVENATWESGGVVFATLHMIMPSPLAGYLPFESDAAAYRSRLIAAGEAWLDEVFADAKARDARGVFLATQVSLWPLSGNALMLELESPRHAAVPPAFAEFEARLARHVVAFRRPVVLANGDTHYFRVDKPLRGSDGETIETFTRVEGFGSPHGHWVRVRVEPERPEVFSFRQELVDANLFTLIPVEERHESYAYRGFEGLRRVLAVIRGTGTALAWIGAFAICLWISKWFRRRRRE